MTPEIRRIRDDEHRPGALRDVDELLRIPDEPWCSTFF
jgi:hypothetical protein